MLRAMPSRSVPGNRTAAKVITGIQMKSNAGDIMADLLRFWSREVMLPGLQEVNRRSTPGLTGELSNFPDVLERMKHGDSAASAPPRAGVARLARRLA